MSKLYYELEGEVSTERKAREDRAIKRMIDDALSEYEYLIERLFGVNDQIDNMKVMTREKLVNEAKRYEERRSYDRPEATRRR